MIWISRDKNGDIAIWDKKPVKHCTSEGEWVGGYGDLDACRNLIKVFEESRLIKTLTGFTPKHGKLYTYEPSGKVTEVK
jgi:hypothetical protein